LATPHVVGIDSVSLSLVLLGTALTPSCLLFPKKSTSA